MTNLKTTLAVLVTLLTLGTAAYGFFTYVTPLEKHQALAAQVYQDRVAFRIWQVQQQIWAIQKNFNCFSINECLPILPPQVRDNYKYLNSELEDLNRKLSE